MLRTIIAGTIAALLVGASAVAVNAAVLNAGFESQVIGEGTFPVGITGWNVIGTGGVYNPVSPTQYAVADGPPEGSNAAYVQTNGGQISQILSDVLTVNTIYTLTVAVGDRADFSFGPNYDIGLYANDTFLASATSPTPSNGKFVDATAIYTALAGDSHLGQAIEIRLIKSGANQEVDFDNVRLTIVTTGQTPAAGVPEPASLALWSLSALGCAIAGYRRRKLA